MDNSPAGTTAVWEVPECPTSVEYSRDVLDRIRLLVLEAFYAFPRGGAEVGGVLFGKYEDSRVHILASRELNCEHAFGPSFVLSANDRARLEKLLADAESDAALAGAVPVGWYHSHTRTEIFLSEQDLEIHGRYFPKPWQVALVLRPSIAGTRAGFFVADADGKMRADSAYREFPVAALGGRALARADQSPRQEPPEVSLPAEPVPEPPAPITPPAVPPPVFLTQPEPPRTTRLWPWAMAGLLLGLGGTVLATRDRWVQVLTGPPQVRAERAEPVALRTEEIGGQFFIRWNPAALPVRNARAASLEIADGEVRNTVPLPPGVLHSGVFTHARRAGRVEVRLNLDGAGETAVFTANPSGTAPPASAEDIRRERDALREELMRARTELVNQTLLIENLRRTIKEMRSASEKAKPAAQPTPAARP